MADTYDLPSLKLSEIACSENSGTAKTLRMPNPAQSAFQTV
ncbi:MAG: hypothetical protein PHP98_01780 [Kiritimatiellae bacterium]|nr:hypothetical protein [Kiritimatiellia bacterium]